MMQAHPSPSIEAERTTTDSIHISLYLDWSKSGSFFVGKINKHYSKWKQTNKTKVKVAKVTFNNLFFFLSFFFKKKHFTFFVKFRLSILNSLNQVNVVSTNNVYIFFKHVLFLCCTLYLSHDLTMHTLISEIDAILNDNGKTTVTYTVTGSTYHFNQFIPLTGRFHFVE